MVTKKSFNAIDAVETWTSLNEAIMSADESQCAELMAVELDKDHGRRRRQFVLRIHSRMNRLRAARERTELLAELSNVKKRPSNS